MLSGMSIFYIYGNIQQPVILMPLIAMAIPAASITTTVKR